MPGLSEPPKERIMNRNTAGLWCMVTQFKVDPA
jgi:hypothetical protein